MRLAVLAFVSLIGVALGLWHGQLAMQAIFVFRENEPLASWLAIGLGPATTLIASVLGIFFPRVGGTWLIASGIASFLIFLAGERGLSESVAPFLLQISVPMVAVGLGFLLAAKLMRGRNLLPNSIEGIQEDR